MNVKFHFDNDISTEYEELEVDYPAGAMIPRKGEIVLHVSPALGEERQYEINTVMHDYLVPGEVLIYARLK